MGNSYSLSPHPPTDLRLYTTFLFDLDGSIYAGADPYPGATDVIGQLRAHGRQIAFLSNNSSDSVMTVRQRLRDAGIETMPETEILLTGELIGPWLRDDSGLMRVSISGSEPVHSSIAEAGHHFVPLHSADACDVLVVGRDDGFSYRDLCACVDRIRNGAWLLATNLDSTHPGDHGTLVPEAGAIVAAIREASGVDRVQSIGKPGPYLYLEAIRRLGAAASECIMIGDNLRTDIMGAQGVGMHSIWISHGSATPRGVDVEPTVTVDGLDELAARLREL